MCVLGRADNKRADDQKSITSETPYDIGSWKAGWRVGRTKVFYRKDLHGWLEVGRSEALAARRQAAIPIQKLMRGYLVRKYVMC